MGLSGQFVSAVDNGHRIDVVGQKDAFLYRGVTAAYNHNVQSV